VLEDSGAQLMTFFISKGFGISLPAVYAIWLLVIAMLYPLWAVAA
jgi:hypothetical protein